MESFGRLRMSIRDCIDTYRDLGSEVFGKKQPFHFFGQNKYDCTKLERLIREVVRRNSGNPADGPLIADPGVLNESHKNARERVQDRCIPCRVGVFAVQSDTHSGMDEKIHLFRSYFNPTHPSARALDDLTINLGHQVLETPIWKIARATSAAPLYFRSIQVDGLRLIDGGILANNPSQLARAEVNSMHQNHPSGTYDPVGGTPEGRIRFLVSLGTGMQASQTIRGAGLAKVVSIFRRALNEMTNPEPVNDELQRALGALNPSAYYRFNVERHLRNMKLDECIMRGGVNLTFSKIERAVTEYFNDGDVLDRSRKLARQLVEHRR